MPLEEYLAWYHSVRKEPYKYRYARIAVILFVLLVLMKVATAATITGTTYDIGLEPLTDVIVDIDTKPPQKIIAKDGKYGFELPQGSYLIKAKYYEDNLLKYEDQQKIEITNEGEFVFDLILFPSLEDDEKLYDNPDLDIENPYDDNTSIVLIVILVLIILGVIGLGYWFFKHKKQNKEEKHKELSSEEITEEKPNDEYYDNILNMIKEHKRITQKEIRKEVPLSEAKISLIISELEHKGKIEKIKKGRGNILVLK
jgi:uncharacterized membrane protein